MSAGATHARPVSWSARRSLLTLGGAVLLCFAAGQIGGVVTRPNLAPWYESLQKPFFNPPNLAFPIAWSLLYAMMAVSLWRVLMLSEGEPRRRAAFAFGVQLVLNVGWSFAFFAAQSPLLGLIEIVGMIAAIVWTILRFRPIDRIAAWLLAPYLVWVLYATALNVSILVLNS